MGNDVTFLAELIDNSEFNGLALADGESVRCAWDFTTNFASGTALLAFDIGLDRSNLKVWKFASGVWTSYAATDLIYDSHGIASFTVAGSATFGDYAISAVPEPVTLSLLAVGSLALLKRRCG